MNETKKAFAWVVALLATLIVVGGVWLVTRLYQGDGSLLQDVVVVDQTISPNADGDTDLTRIQYTLSRDAIVSIYLERKDGTGAERHYFRKEKLRGAGDYAVNFSGVVAGYQLPDDVVAGEILARLLQDGAYTLWIEATEEGGETQVESRDLMIVSADSALPDLAGFELNRTAFSPNRDGIADRLQVQFDLKKEAERLRVFLLTPDGMTYPISEKPRDVPENAEGRHVFDYAGGVDQGAAPPEDGVYDIVAIAEDAEGQQVRVSEQVAIQYGGVPRAEIVSPATGDTLEFSAAAVQLCNTLHFTVTVRNYGVTPIRTTGPEPGTVYDSDWNYNTVGWQTESGAWRIALGYENELKDYAYRWAVGNRDQLTEIDGHYYLMGGQQVVVTGGIRIVGPLGERNPQPLWAGLIHEDVEISQFNNRVNPHAINIDIPTPDQTWNCEPREIVGREN